MPTHAEKKIFRYSPEQLFDLVADVEKYPLFLPWCSAIRVKSRQGNVIVADMVIGFKIFRETFTTRVTLQRPENGIGSIDVEYLNGPFHYLNNHWLFEPHEDGCRVGFFIDFEFRSIILQKTIGAVFNEVVTRMVGTFEKRADEIYG